MSGPITAPVWSMAACTPESKTVSDLAGGLGEQYIACRSTKSFSGAFGHHQQGAICQLPASAIIGTTTTFRAYPKMVIPQ